MGIRTALSVYLSGVAALTSLLGGSGTSCRLFGHDAPQGTASPYATFIRVGPTRRPYDLGAVGTLRQTVFQLDVYGNSMGSVEAVTDELEVAMHAFTGTWSGVTVDRAVCDGPDFDDDEPLGDGSQNVKFHTVQRWTVTYHAARE